MAQEGQLVGAGQGDPVGVIALLDDAHGGHDLPQPLGEPQGENAGEDDQQHFQDQSDAENGGLQIVDQGALGGVVFHHIHAAHGDAVAHHRGGGPGLDHAVMVFAGEIIVARHSFQNFRQQGVAALGGAGRVVEHQTRLVRDHGPGDGHALQIAQGGLHRGGVHDFQRHDLIHRQQAFFFHGRFLALVEQGLTGV